MDPKHTNQGQPRTIYSGKQATKFYADRQLTTTLLLFLGFGTEREQNI